MSKRFIISEQQAQKLGPEHFRTVHHMEGSTDDSEVWIDFWQKQTGHNINPKEGFHCPSCYKTQTEIVGGHVVDDETGDVYITPVCDECNKKYKNSKADTHHFYVRACNLVKLQK